QSPSDADDLNAYPGDGHPQSRLDLTEDIRRYLLEKPPTKRFRNAVCLIGPLNPDMDVIRHVRIVPAGASDRREFAGKPRFAKRLQRVVHRRETHRLGVSLHKVMKLVGCRMPLTFGQRFIHRNTLPGRTESVLRKEFGRTISSIRGPQRTHSNQNQHIRPVVHVEPDIILGKSLSDHTSVAPAPYDIDHLSTVIAPVACFHRSAAE